LFDVSFTGGFALENDIRNRKKLNERGNESEKGRRQRR
jgi:hypothetical protein